MFGKFLLAVLAVVACGQVFDVPTYKFKGVQILLEILPEADPKYLEAFLEFKISYGRQYGSMELLIEKFHTFSRNMDLVEQLNKESDGSVTYALNEFSDLSDEEWKQYMMKPRNKPQVPTPKKIKKLDNTLPSYVDWRHVNDTVHVTGIKYQGPCGSCWAFATAAAIESAVSINGGVLESLSAQEMLDCTPVSDKCGGGEPSEALAYARDHGVSSAVNYPYLFWSNKCKVGRPIAAKISGWIEAEDEEEMAQVVANNGPMIVCANFATNKNRFYHSGIAEDKDCGTEPTHALVVVGYGEDYWLLKNTYSAYWGENGYMRVRRGVNWCGIITEKPLLPIL